MTLIEKAEKYISHIEPSIQHSGGRQQALKVSLALIKGFSLSEAQALVLFQNWNGRCVPPWSDHDLTRFLRDAAKTSKPDGYLLLAAKPTTVGVDPATIARHRRQSWPLFLRATAEDLEVIAAVRGITSLSLYGLRNHGFLSRCIWKEQSCFVIHDGTFAQARRMDGKPFVNADGKTIKALNLPGSAGTFLNPGGLGDAGTPVILTEGVISLAESIEFVNRVDDAEGRLHPVTVIAATSAGSRFSSEWLQKLRGRPILIICDDDPTGRDAAATWSASLRSVDCRVKTALPPSGCKDLGDALKAVPAGNLYWVKLFTF